MLALLTVVKAELRSFFSVFTANKSGGMMIKSTKEGSNGIEGMPRVDGGMQ